MAATIRRLTTRPDQIRGEQAARLRQALLPFADEMPEQVRAMVGYIDRRTASRNGWTFMLMNSMQNAAVVDWLVENSRRPIKAMRLWALCFVHLDLETNEVLLRRDELAERLSIRPDDVSAIMGELEGIGAIMRRRERGTARYFLNPTVATHLGGAKRDAAQAKAPPGPVVAVQAADVLSLAVVPLRRSSSKSRRVAAVRSDG